MVFSYAPNLANHRQQKEPPGIRMDFTDHLRGAFATLEKYGITMKSELGGEFKRSIKYDDSEMNLRIDVLFPGDTNWTRVSLEIAQEEVERRKRNENAATRERVLSVSKPSTSEQEPSTHTVVAPTQLTQSSTLVRHSRPEQPRRWGNL